MLTSDEDEQNVFNKIIKDASVREQISNILQCNDISVYSEAFLFGFKYDNKSYIGTFRNDFDIYIVAYIIKIRKEDIALCCKKVSSQYNRHFGAFEISTLAPSFEIIPFEQITGPPESSETDESTVADHDLYLLLQDWNLKHLYNHFIDHHITIKVLKILKPKHIDMLFYGLPIGDMVTFEDEFEKWKKTHIDESTNLEKPRCFNQQQFVSVNTILQDTENGKQILKYYEKNKILHEGHRNLLIDTISKYIEAKGYKLSISQCADLEKEICKIFPSEELEYYNTGKRGKLYNKIFNLKRLSKGIFKSEEEPDTNLRDELVSQFKFFEVDTIVTMKWTYIGGNVINETPS
ncbi:hypothetical protein CVS40_12068 [Lucilia cuprina]|nr:hypothetical protein CVS40_12068 [Lucilia cuprina]